MTKKKSKSITCGCPWWFCLFCNTFLFIALSIFIFWLIFLPQELIFHIINASLTQFNFNTTTKTLYYNLAFDITIRNPNKKIGINYNKIQTIAYYGEKRFAILTLDDSRVVPFYQGHKNTTNLTTLFEGQQFGFFHHESEIKMFEIERISGIYSIDVELALKVKAMYGKLNFGYAKSPNVKCKLRLPLFSNNNESFRNAGYFKLIKCEHVYVLTGPVENV